MQNLRPGLYQVLGVPEFVDYNQIRQAYRAAAKRFHPDVTQEDKQAAEARFKEVNDAWFILGRPETKA